MKIDEKPGDSFVFTCGKGGSCTSPGGEIPIEVEMVEMFGRIVPQLKLLERPK